MIGVEDRDAVQQAVESHAAGLDLADGLRSCQLSPMRWDGDL